MLIVLNKLDDIISMCERRIKKLNECDQKWAQDEVGHYNKILDKLETLFHQMYSNKD